MMGRQPHRIVVGAGIIGASLAWHLAEAGARVTVLDTGPPGGVATRASWAWINASFGNPEPYFRLRLRAMQEWRRVAAAIPEMRVTWPGGLYWERPAEEVEALAAQHAAWGYELRRVSRAEVRQIEPHLVAPPDFAIHVPAEGVTEPLAAAQAFLAAAAGRGASIVGQCRVRAMICADRRVTGVETDQGPMMADEVIIAAGVGTPRLLQTAGANLPMKASPGLVVATAPHAPILNGLLITPRMELRQTAEGRLLAVGRADAFPPENGAEAAAMLLNAIRETVDVGAALSAGFHVMGERPIPDDGFPAVGRIAGLAGLYLAVTHSGITLAPAIGRFAAAEMLTGERHPLLAPYGPDRFTPG